MKIPAALLLVLGCALFSPGLSAAEPPQLAAGSADRSPVPIFAPEPAFPGELRKHALVAEVIVAFVVDQTGHVTDLRISDALVGRFSARGIIPHYVYNGNYALGRFIPVPPDGGKASPNPAHILPEAPIVEVGSLRGAPTYIGSSQSDFGEAARKAIATWIYAPGQKNGHPVDTRMRVLVMYWKDGRVSTGVIE